MKTHVLETKILEDMDENAQKLQKVIMSLVDGRNKLKAQHRQEFTDYEKNMLDFFWKCRGRISTSSMARMLNISRQALYQKWNAYGYAINDPNLDDEGE